MPPSIKIKPGRNKLVMIFIACLVLYNFSTAQIPKEAFPLTNALSDLWHNGETGKAIESSLELYRLYPPMFIERIHNTLAQQLQNDPKQYGQKYLELLHLEENDNINKIISPIYLWSKTINTIKESDLKKIAIELYDILTDSANYESKTEKYCLLILQELDKKNAIDNKNKIKVLQKCINNLEAYPFIDKAVTERSEGEKRAWHRYLLAYSFNALYLLKPTTEEYLKKASDYSPDLNDRLYQHAYVYDAVLLTDNTTELGFQTQYQKYLADNNRNSEALNLLSDIAFGNPSDHNIKSLKYFYEKLENTKPFNDYWKNYVHSMGKPVPRIKIKFETEELDLTIHSNKWIYIDVWGTWCIPCRTELPGLQSFYVENRNNIHSNLKIYTFSFGSQNLPEFMNENKYTFPVSEIDKLTNALFEITGYPTRILITPNGHYIKIPFGEDWKLYLKNYTLM